MSVKIMGEVWSLALPQNEAWILMAMADHADHEGANVYPSAGLIAWKTGYEIRSVQRIIDRLEARGVLVLVAAPVGAAKRYRIDLSKVERKPDYVGKKRRKAALEGGDILSPPAEEDPGQDVIPGGDMGVTKRRPGGDIAMSPEPSWNHEPSEESSCAPAAPSTTDDAISIYERLTGNAGTPKDREAAAEIADVPARAVELGIARSIERCPDGDSVGSLRYCLDQIRKAAKQLGSSFVGAAPSTEPPRPVPAPLAPPPAPSTIGALALAASPVEYSNDAKAPIWAAAREVLVTWSAMHGRAPSRDELRAQLLDHAIEHGLDLGLVDACYPASTPPARPPAHARTPVAPVPVPAPSAGDLTEAPAGSDDTETRQAAYREGLALLRERAESHEPEGGGRHAEGPQEAQEVVGAVAD